MMDRNVAILMVAGYVLLVLVDFKLAMAAAGIHCLLSATDTFGLKNTAVQNVNIYNDGGDVTTVKANGKVTVQ